MPMLIVLAIPVLLALWAIAIYNRLVRNRNLVQEGWSGIEVQLKRRTDLLPNLIRTVEGYMTHEKEVLQNVTELRAKSMQTSDPKAKSQVENALSRSLASLFAVAENYPDLKANQNFLDLQQQLAELEDQIQMSRRYYNGTVRNLNIMIESFPSNLIAGQFNFEKAEFFDMDDKEGAVPEVKF